MNAIVVTALRHPLTFVVFSILILMFGILAIFKTPTDVFPNIKIPVVSVVWAYNGMLPEQFAGRIIYNFELNVTSTVNNIERMESNSYYGRGIVNIFFQPGTDLGSVLSGVQHVLSKTAGRVPRSAAIDVRGQATTMHRPTAS